MIKSGCWANSRHVIHTTLTHVKLWADACGWGTCVGLLFLVEQNDSWQIFICINSWICLNYCHFYFEIKGM